MVRFVHTADLQLGMPFNFVPDDRGAKLRDLRFAVIDRVVDLAHQSEASFIVVAGDLFDANTVDDRTVEQACARFGRSRVPVYAIPGNHDHGGPGSVWQRARFKLSRPENLKVLEDRQPVPVAGGHAVLLPAPLIQRHERGDTTAHWTPSLGRELAPSAVRIGLAHGGVSSFGEAEGHNLIDPQRAQRADLDYVALGDWHGAREAGVRAWYAGTPEPTGFKDNNAGNVLVVTAGRGVPPRIDTVSVGRARWVRHAETLNGEEDIERLGRWFHELDDPLETLVRLELEGALSFGDMERLEALLSRMEGRLIYLRRKDAGLMPRGRDEELASIATAGFVAEAITRLRAETSAGGEPAARAARALQLLFRLHRARVSA